jgi:protein-disulfide isomerase/uncharacterized membrane protein
MVLMLGSAFLLVAIIASGMMVLKHFGRLELPGCGVGSGCDQAAASRWGKVLGTPLPTSFFGLAYFLGIFLAWVGNYGVLSVGTRGIVRVSALASAGLLVVMVAEKLTCPYCIATHICNLGFWLLVEAVRKRGAPRSYVPDGVAGAVMAVSCIALVGFDSRARAIQREKDEQALRESTQQMTAPKPPPSQPQPVSPQAGNTPSTQPPTQAQSTSLPVQPTVRGFSGRYRWGPEKATVRIVMYTDYQCPDCKRIEGDLAELQKHPNVAVLIKHFPLSTQCNPRAPGDMHPNACWAARAAQAAGILQGEDGFWRMHHWLFSVGGSFTDASFPGSLRELGFDPQQFLATMQGPETLQRVKADIDEGLSLGLFYTPLIFINGIELKGWNAPNALNRAVSAVLAVNPEPETFADDVMPTALEKYMSDWREQPVRQIPAEITARFVGPKDAPVTVVLFGDYMESGTQEADGVLRLFASGPDAKFKYSFAQFPVDHACNPVITKPEGTKFASCPAAQAAEAADLSEGPEGFWKMHHWLMVSKGAFTDEALNQELGLHGLDMPQFRAAMAHPTVAEKIRSHARAAQTLGIQTIPMVFIDGKHVPRFKLDNENLLPRMIDEAAAARAR